jgi:hypothetical protein
MSSKEPQGPAQPTHQSALTGEPHPPLSDQVLNEARILMARVAAGEPLGKSIEGAISIFGNAALTAAVPWIEGMLRHEDHYIRAMALQSLVLDFHLPRHCATAQQLLVADDPDVQRIAASCLGFCHAGTRNLAVLTALAGLLRDETEDRSVRETAYEAILSVVGYSHGHPIRPKRTKRSEFGFRVINLASEVDWDLIDRIERGDPPKPEWPD